MWNSLYRLQLGIWITRATFHIITNRLQFLRGRIANDIDWTDFGSMICDHRIFAEQFDANVADEYRNAGS